jgi:hypothetical protein
MSLWRYKNEFLFQCAFALSKLKAWWNFHKESDENYINRRFLKVHQYPMNWEKPETLNQKIQWSKRFGHKPEYTTMADKLAVRDFFATEIGSEYLIPLLYRTRNPKTLQFNDLPEVPFVVKANHDSGSYQIFRDRKEVNLPLLQRQCRWWLGKNYYWVDREPEYRDIVPEILIEKLLQTPDGHIPNDYKFNVFGGKVGFIYVSVDREGTNKRNIYDRSWNPLYFTWAAPGKDVSQLRGSEIPPPKSLDRMIEIAEQLGRHFNYIRVDLYEIEGRIYFGELTQHHGGGFDRMLPVEWDYRWGAEVK